MAGKEGPDLKRFMDKRVQIKMNKDRIVTGELRGYDQFMNVVLDNCVEEVSDSERHDLGMVCNLTNAECISVSTCIHERRVLTHASQTHVPTQVNPQGQENEEILSLKKNQYSASYKKLLPHIQMFEARIEPSALLKKILEALKELVVDASWNCDARGMSLQAMDTSHVALVNVMLKCEGFDHYRCDQNLNLGINQLNMGKMLKCAGNDDIVTMKADDNGDILTLVFESVNGDRDSEFELKLIDLDSEHLGIPEMDYDASVEMASAEFQRIVRDLGSLGDTVIVAITKEGVSFEVKGDLGAGKMSMRQNTNVDKPAEDVTVEMKEPVNVRVAFRYLASFTKATPLADRVRLSMSEGSPLKVEYKVGNMGYISYFLAPKIEDEDEE